MPNDAASTREAIESILRLRRAEKRADDEARREIAAARQYLEDLVGPTVRPADAARALMITQPALMRWMEKGEVSTVTTPQGRREIPLAELSRPKRSILLAFSLDAVLVDIGRPSCKLWRITASSPSGSTNTWSTRRSAGSSGGRATRGSIPDGPRNGNGSWTCLSRAWRKPLAPTRSALASSGRVRRLRDS